MAKYDDNKGHEGTAAAKTPLELARRYLEIATELSHLSPQSPESEIAATKKALRGMVAHDLFLNGTAGTIDPAQGESLFAYLDKPTERETFEFPKTAADAFTEFLADFLIESTKGYRVKSVVGGSLRSSNRIMVEYELQSVEDSSNWLTVAEHLTYGLDERGALVIKRIDVVADILNQKFP